MTFDFAEPARRTSAARHQALGATHADATYALARSATESVSAASATATGPSLARCARLSFQVRNSFNPSETRRTVSYRRMTLRCMRQRVSW